MGPDKNTLNELRIDRSKRPRRGSPGKWVGIALILLVLLAVAGWWFAKPKVITVRTTIVRERSGSGGSGNTLLNASGYVTARRAATVSAKITGKVMEVLVEEGMKVEAGQIVARLDAANAEKNLQLAQARLASAKTALAETRANLTRADREWQRLKQLAADQVASASSLDVGEAEAAALKARLEHQQAEVSVAGREVALAEQQVDDTIVRAPFAGVVTSKDAQPGEMISPMSSGGFTRTGICTIVDMNSLEVEVDVNESYINRVEPGQRVEATLDSYPDWKIPAKVIAIIPTADRQKATVRVRIGFDQLDARILPDMAVKVAFQRSGDAPVVADGITLPASAIQKQDGRDSVWIVRDGRVERRAVTVGSTRGTEATIAAGLSTGDKVVIGGADKLTEGAHVTENKP